MPSAVTALIFVVEDLMRVVTVVIWVNVMMNSVVETLISAIKSVVGAMELVICECETVVCIGENVRRT